MRNKGRGHDDLRGQPYNISHAEIVRRTKEAIDRDKDNDDDDDSMCVVV